MMRMKENEKVQRRLFELIEEGKRDGSIAGWELNEVLTELARRLRTSVEKVMEAKFAAVDTVSLDIPVGDGDDATLGAFVEDQGAVSPDEITFNSHRHLAVHNALETLTAREAEVLRYRYGFHDGQTYTLEKLAEKYGLTRERVRQIEAKALCKLRHPSRAWQLRDYCG